MSNFFTLFVLNLVAVVVIEEVAVFKKYILHCYWELKE